MDHGVLSNPIAQPGEGAETWWQRRRRVVADAGGFKRSNGSELIGDVGWVGRGMQSLPVRIPGLRSPGLPLFTLSPFE